MGCQMSLNEAGIDAEVAALDAVMPEPDLTLPTIIITSNFGTGEPPGNAKLFFEWIEALSPDAPPANIDRLKFGVFGLGNKDYGGSYQKVGRLIDERLLQAGAQQLVERGEGDSSTGHDPEDDFEAWIPHCIAAIQSLEAPAAEAKPASSTQPVEVLVEDAPATSNDPFELRPLIGCATRASVTGSGVLLELPRPQSLHTPRAPTDEIALADAYRPALGRVVDQKELHGLLSARSCSHVAFEIDPISPAFGDTAYEPVRFAYRTGDYLGVYPANSEEDIERALYGFRYVQGVAEQFSPAVLSAGAVVTVGNAKSAAALASNNARFPTTLDTALRFYIDLSRPAPRRLLRLLTSRATSDSELKHLETLNQLAKSTTHDSLQHAISTAGVLSRVSPSLLARVAPAELLAHLTPAQPRFYSISSAASVHWPQAWLACGRATHWDVHRSTSYTGCSSRFLSRLKPGDTAHVFPVPSDCRVEELTTDSQPIVMIANGSGLAPFRGFIEERIARGSTGASCLVYGCMYPDDFLYREDILGWERAGHCEAYPVYSHHQAEELRSGALQFVQHRLVAGDPVGERVWELIHDQGGVVFLCGTPAMGNGVIEALNALSLRKTGNSHFVERLAAEKRFIREVFA